ncbi:MULTISPECIES: TetR/AcrR family transcriptional regulator [unclassified Kaistella]|uniref:TetR/AcrR family transcriptional regulator n=1 Tax=unclassified Kaistella TaxID=2762626 RepID=UPI0027368F64|nr:MULTISPECIES: TetR/AcrR family transcriptional regulator [unclassified Kaistella]MDP2454018.1 TetR/AcrR family transcriptional regulator [Kaistella sp. SH11-4b]MDP2457075.1 TetR/AcrR family transcriptional regulator [Kaistella sp. SH40-3]MDP2459832.1 TetR/AcrR family transcriptional regulator [Kaistella sp. SH19-2b]
MITKEEHILLHAEKLFAEKGFEGSSTREISEKAKVNVSMISYYFGSKEKLFVKIFEVRMNESLKFSEDVLANQNLNEWEKLVIIINRYADRVKNLKTFYRILQREQLNSKNPVIAEFLKKSKKGFLAIYTELFEKGFEKKIFHKKPRIEFVHSTVSGTIFTALNTLPIYKEFFQADENYEDLYFDEIKIHVQNILKHLLGYEENI